MRTLLQPASWSLILTVQMQVDHFTHDHLNSIYLVCSCNCNGSHQGRDRCSSSIHPSSHPVCLVRHAACLVCDRNLFSEVQSRRHCAGGADPSKLPIWLMHHQQPHSMGHRHNQCLRHMSHWPVQRCTQLHSMCIVDCIYVPGTFINTAGTTTSD